MTPLKAVTLTTPDGVSRVLRDTPGARKRIAEYFGEPNFGKLAKEKGDWVFYPVAYCMMYDRSGNPPVGLAMEDFVENAPASQRIEVIAAVMSAASNGERPKNEIEALLTQAEGAIAMELLTGSASGPSLPSASGSPTINSGGDTPGSNSTPGPSDTTNENGEKTAA